MRIPTICTQCVQDGNPAMAFLLTAEVQDDGVYEIECPFGHSGVIALQEMKFEILFELGVNAIFDGYYREAVASFASGLERFFEFYIRVICGVYKIDAEKVTAAWKAVERQSERQLGAYVMAHLLDAREPPALLPIKQVEFRNDVIHRGYIPRKEEAIKFGNVSSGVVIPCLSELKKKYGDAVTGEVRRHMAAAVARANGRTFSGMSIASLVSIARLEGSRGKSEVATACPRNGCCRFGNEVISVGSDPPEESMPIHNQPRWAMKRGLNPAACH
jgi:hypothetical protein